MEILRHESHLLCVAPTGSGKSLIYERIAASRWTRTLLVSPLVALARQQAERLAAAGVRVWLASGQSGTRAEEPVGDGAWIVSPEHLTHEGRQAALDRWRPNFLVIDECHCFWEWGESFRPAFLGLPRLATRYPSARSLWLTATLPAEARHELRAAMLRPWIERGEFALPSGLRVHVRQVPWPDRARTLLGWVRSVPGPGLVFVGTRESARRIARFLATEGLRARPYHGGLAQEERRRTEVLAAAGELDVLVATSAFGMGMDLARLRWAVLWQAPASLLALAQAIGRVGRGESRGDALLLWAPEDFQLLEWTIDGSERRRRELVRAHAFFRGDGCPQARLRAYFDGPGAARCPPGCANCGGDGRDYTRSR